MIVFMTGTHIKESVICQLADTKTCYCINEHKSSKLTETKQTQTDRQEVHLSVEVYSSSCCLSQLVGDLLTLLQTDRLFNIT